MAKKLKNPPLTYVLGQIKISPILDMHSFIPDIQGRLRKELPNYNEIETIDVNVQSSKTDARVNTRWHFSDKESTTGVLLDKDTIIFHTTNYDKFEKFSETLSNILINIDEVLEIGLCSRFGLRYINLIDDNLEKIVKKELLGFPLKIDDIKEDNHGFYKTESVSQTKCGGIIKLQSTYTHVDRINTKDFSIFVPPDLSQVASLLSFIRKGPKEEFLLLDIDHFMFKKDFDFNVKEIAKDFDSLHDAVSKAFLSALSDEGQSLLGAK